LAPWRWRQLENAAAAAGGWRRNQRSSEIWRRLAAAAPSPLAAGGWRRRRKLFLRQRGIGGGGAYILACGARLSVSIGRSVSAAAKARQRRMAAKIGEMALAWRRQWRNQRLMAMAKWRLRMTCVWRA